MMAVTIVFISILITQQLVMSAYNMHSEALDIREYGARTGDSHRSYIDFADFNVTNITSDVLNISFYLVNNGSGNIETGCEDIMINGSWIPDFNESITIVPTDFDEYVFNPSGPNRIHAIAVNENYGDLATVLINPMCGFLCEVSPLQRGQQGHSWNFQP